jgi:hypothetical protein
MTRVNFLGGCGISVFLIGRGKAIPIVKGGIKKVRNNFARFGTHFKSYCNWRFCKIVYQPIWQPGGDWAKIQGNIAKASAMCELFRWIFSVRKQG